MTEGADESGQRTAAVVRGVLALGRRLRAERPAGSASLVAIGLLATLHRLGPMPAARLAAEERLQPQSLTRLLAELERGGLIVRSVGVSDRRERVIEMTPAGRDVLTADMRARRAWLDAAMAASLSPAERAAVEAAAPALLKLAGYRPEGRD